MERRLERALEIFLTVNELFSTKLKKKETL